MLSKFLDSPSGFSRLFMVVSVLCRSFTSLARDFNIFIRLFAVTILCLRQQTRANESISDRAVNVNSETKALTNKYNQIENALCIQIFICHNTSFRL